MIPGQMVRISQEHVLVDRWRRDAECTSDLSGIVLDAWGPTESDPYPWFYVMFNPCHRVRHYMFREEELELIS